MVEMESLFQTRAHTHTHTPIHLSEKYTKEIEANERIDVIIFKH